MEEYVANSIKYLCEAELVDINNPFVLDNNFKLILYTNLGNAFSMINRSNDAIYSYTKAINIYENFSMATGNLGLCILKYSEYSYDKSHKQLMQLKAMELLKRALDNPKYIQYDNAYKDFEFYYNGLHETYKNLSLPDISDYEANYKTKKERMYRKWVNDNKLFLNDLNDIFQEQIVERDVLGLPTIAILINELEKKMN